MREQQELWAGSQVRAPPSLPILCLSSAARAEKSRAWTEILGCLLLYKIALCPPDPTWSPQTLPALTRTHTILGQTLSPLLCCQGHRGPAKLIEMLQRRQVLGLVSGSRDDPEPLEPSPAPAAVPAAWHGACVSPSGAAISSCFVQTEPEGTGEGSSSLELAGSRQDQPTAAGESWQHDPFRRGLGAAGG